MTPQITHDHHPNPLGRFSVSKKRPLHCPIYYSRGACKKCVLNSWVIRITQVAQPLHQLHHDCTRSTHRISTALTIITGAMILKSLTELSLGLALHHIVLAAAKWALPVAGLELAWLRKRHPQLTTGTMSCNLIARSLRHVLARRMTSSRPRLSLATSET